MILTGISLGFTNLKSKFFISSWEKPERSLKEELRDKHRREEKRDDFEKERERDKRRERKEEKLAKQEERQYRVIYSTFNLFQLLSIYSFRMKDSMKLAQKRKYVIPARSRSIDTTRREEVTTIVKSVMIEKSH